MSRSSAAGAMTSRAKSRHRSRTAVCSGERSKSIAPNRGTAYHRAVPDDPYQEALEVVKGLQALDGPNVNPVCHTRLYTHGHRTERALVLLHGFTNCPRQFDDLGRQLFEA